MRSDRPDLAAQYAATHRRLSGTCDYERLKAAAQREALTAPTSYFARNRLALHVELNMPPL